MQPKPLSLKSFRKHYKRSRKRNDTSKEIHRGFEIVPECLFKIQDMEYPVLSWVLQFLKETGLIHIATPVDNIYYPRLVYEFYENFEAVADAGFYTKVNGKILSFSIDDLAKAWSLDDVYPEGCHYPPLLDNIDFYNRDQHLRVRGCSHNFFIHQCQLPEHLWVVDALLYRNLLPTGHKTKRHALFTKALFGIHTEHWFSAPNMIFSEMSTIAYRMQARSIHLPRPKLFFPFLITKLLEIEKVTMDPNEPIGKLAPVFGIVEWETTLRSFRRRIEGTRLEAQRRARTDDYPNTDNEGYDGLDTDSDDEAPRPRNLRPSRLEIMLDSYDVLQENIKDTLITCDNLSGKVAEIQDLLKALRETQTPEEVDKILAHAEHYKKTRLNLF